MSSTLQFTEPASYIAMLLDSLGHTADDVANELRAGGIKGVRNTVRSMNPLIRYLQTEFQAQFGTKVFMDVIRGDILRMVLLNGEKKEVSLSNATFLFLIAFDRGLYPDLEDISR